MDKQELIEQLAEKEHASWARWMSYVFELCGTSTHGIVAIPAGLVARWQKQIETPYAELSEQEKQSDRDEVTHILPIIEEYTDGKLQNAAIKTISRGGLVSPIGKHLMTPLQGE